MSYSSFAKGLAAGMAVGTVAVIFTRPMTDRQRHKIQRKTESVFKNIGGIIDTALDMMK